VIARDRLVTGRVVWPPLLVVIGFFVAFLVFFWQEWYVLVAGVVLILIGAIWSLVRNRGRRGIGPARIPESR
jgi:hypothetical protein